METLRFSLISLLIFRKFNAVIYWKCKMNYIAIMVSRINVCGDTQQIFGDKYFDNTKMPLIWK